MFLCAVKLLEEGHNCEQMEAALARVSQHCSSASDSPASATTTSQPATHLAENSTGGGGAGNKLPPSSTHTHISSERFQGSTVLDSERFQGSTVMESSEKLQSVVVVGSGEKSQSLAVEASHSEVRTRRPSCDPLPSQTFVHSNSASPVTVSLVNDEVDGIIMASSSDMPVDGIIMASSSDMPEIVSDDDGGEGILTMNLDCDGGDAGGVGAGTATTVEEEAERGEMGLVISSVTSLHGKNIDLNMGQEEII
jgi:hypothetical protein